MSGFGRDIMLGLVGSTGIIIWSLVMIGLTVAGLAVAMQMKKRLTDVETSSASPGGFTLSDLRRMVEEGKLTAEEFEKARQKIVEAAQRTHQRSSNKPLGPS